MMKKIFLSLILFCSLQSQAQYVPITTWNAFLSRYKSDTAASKSLARKQDSTIKILLDRVTKLEAALQDYKLVVIDPSITIGDTLKANFQPIYKSLTDLNKRIDSNAIWLGNVFKYAVSNLRLQNARTDSLVKVLPVDFNNDLLDNFLQRILLIETSVENLKSKTESIQAWADRVKLITLQ